jgi:hypothetical protein
VAQPGIRVTVQELKTKWEEFLAVVRPANYSVEALLRSAQPYEIKGSELIIKVYYEFHKGRLETDKNLSIVENAFEKLFAIKPKIRYILGEKLEKLHVENKKDEELAQTVEEIFS